ncbi:MAG TPA: asparagine synthase (glutamine-hydrolyzing), partial [Thermoanaerobaculia bacterium]|nr:asparagine synthase (glutamine-hydrolyzing) [Thermoanaerobaculia bacterium]
MCGIVGYAGRESIDAATLERMSAALAHRGPDDAGAWRSADGRAGFAFRRLAVIDLSPGGHQPMTEATGRVHIAFNGEIYNYLDLRDDLARDGFVFRTQSDTEVILNAYRKWGESFVEKLNGMFAIALYDDERRVLFLARDRAGEKPLFYWRTPQRVVFASELKALFALPGFPRRLDQEALEHYFAYGYAPRAASLLEGVAKLAPGHIAKLDLDSGAWSGRAWWDLPSPAGDAGDAAELEHELESLLEDAVRRQLVADVPVAVLLSGGVDSSVITAMAVRARTKVKTFTVTFPNNPFDESAYARLVANHLGTDHVEVDAGEMPVTLLETLARQYDEPIGDSSMVPTYVVSRLIREHATVAVGGDGGDELFGGYPHYNYVQSLQRVRRAVPRPVRRVVSAVARKRPVGSRGRSYLVGLAREGKHAIADVNVYFDREMRRALLRTSPRDSHAPEETRIALGADGRTVLQAAQRSDFRGHLADDILTKVDRASMLASLETRAPFLDHRLVEFAFGRVPDALKADAKGGRKILLRRLAARVLPPELDLTRKQGFSIPLADWLRGAWGPFFRDVLGAADGDIFRAEVIEELLRNQERRLNNGHRLFALVMFEL